jgi:hypothetical protein
MTIEPREAHSELVKVATATNQSEAELLQNLLLGAGVSSTLRRSAGFDVPDYLAAGPRDVLVESADVAVADQILLRPTSRAEEPARLRDAGPAPLRLGAGLLAGLALVIAFLWLVSAMF